MSVQRLRKIKLLCSLFLLPGTPGEEPHPRGPVTAFQRIYSEPLVFKAARFALWEDGQQWEEL